jgi:hypothetical protein
MYKRLWVPATSVYNHFYFSALPNRRLDFAGQEVLSLSRYKNRLKKYLSTPGTVTVGAVTAAASTAAAASPQ